MSGIEARAIGCHRRADLGRHRCLGPIRTSSRLFGAGLIVLFGRHSGIVRASMTIDPHPLDHRPGNPRQKPSRKKPVWCHRGPLRPSIRRPPTPSNQGPGFLRQTPGPEKNCLVPSGTPLGLLVPSGPRRISLHRQTAASTRGHRRAHATHVGLSPVDRLYANGWARHEIVGLDRRAPQRALAQAHRVFRRNTAGPNRRNDLSIELDF
jgi:hypothetical protein